MNINAIVRVFICACLFQTSIALAQETDSTEQVTTNTEFQSSKQVSVDRVGLDRRINEGFAPFGKGVGDIIFYAPTIAEDILYAEQGVLRSTDDFYDEPPFRVQYTKTDGPAFKKIFSVKTQENGQLQLVYEQSKEVPLNQELELDGIKLTITHNSGKYNSASDQIQLDIVSDQELDGFEFSTLPIDENGSIESLESVIVTYPHYESISPGVPVEAEGFSLTVAPNEASNFQLSSDKVYTFQIIELQFLPIVIILLIVGALFFTLFYRFINLRMFGLALNVVRGKYEDPHEKQEGEVTHFQALSAALSGTVGLGNIAGVAIAISIGGAGATFWMIICGLLGMSTKFVECTLGVKYRRINEKGVVSGGPMYYLSEGLSKRGLGGLGKIFAIFFSIMTIGGSFGGGNMFQVNQAFKQFQLVTGGEDSFITGNAWLFGLVMAILIAIVIIGGIRSIAKVTDKIVPFMCGIYVLAALIIIGMNLGEVPRVFGEIFAGAFAPTAVAGGLIGVLIQGFRRAAFSNEAGVGSAPIAHAAVKTKHPASEGIVALLEPFIDTVVVCTMTALVIIITNNHLDPNASDGVQLTSAAFTSAIPFFNYVLAVAVILFAFSTMVTWSYYGLKAWTFLFGDNKVTDTAYKILFCIMVIIGSAATLTAVTDFSDAMIFAMSVPNIIGLVILRKEVQEELTKYLDYIRNFVAERV